VTRGRTSVTIAHRLSTAESADDVLVFDAGRVVERGRHADLLALGGVYARLHASWRGSVR
jgi:putative ABC transport system ATP-binding protein